jgi:hypothetical protein
VEESTYVAAARLSSIVLDFVNDERNTRKQIVDSKITTMRAAVAFIMLHITTGITRISVIRVSKSSFAIHSIVLPE